MLRSVAIRVQSPGEPQAQVEASMRNTMPIPLLRHVVAMTNLAFPVGFHSVSMESARQAAASAGRPPGPAAGSSGVVAQQCAQGAAAPEVEVATALRTARVIQPPEDREMGREHVLTHA